MLSQVLDLLAGADLQPLRVAIQSGEYTVRISIKPTAEKPPPHVPPPVRTHNETFTCVEWDGCQYVFTPLQAAAVKVLWEAKEAGSPPLHQQQILTEIESDSNRLAMVFRGPGGYHVAWGRVVVAAGRGHFKLAD